MSLKVAKLERVFKYNGVELKDIPGLTPQQIIKHYAGAYPEIVNSSFEYKGIIDGKEMYSADKSVGIKG